VAVTSLMASSIPTPSASQIVISSSESARPSEGVTGRESRAAYRDVVLADVAHGDVASGDAVLGDWRSPVTQVADSPDPARKKRTVRYVSAGVAVVAIAMAGLLMLRPRVGSGKPPVSTGMSAPQRTTGAGAGAPVATVPATTIASIGTATAARLAAAHADSLRAASATPVPTAAVIPREQRAPELRAPRVEVHLDSVNMPSMPAAPSVDAILRSAERQRASDTNRAETRDEVSRSTSADVEHAHTSPKIIGRPPEPAFPDALLRSGRREGQVVVRFIVNELGAVDVASIIVERTDHEMFTDAVRDVLPRFRFEPAHTLTPESKPVAAWVSVPFRFTTKKR